ncbi:hypothetical protein HDZ31DRAFT_46533 [Schizophyllum fasciatum]
MYFIASRRPGLYSLGVHHDLFAQLPLLEPAPLTKDFRPPVPITDALRWQHDMPVEFMPFTRYASALWDNSIERLRRLDPQANFETQYMVFYPLLMPVYLATYDVVGKTELSEYTLVLDARSPQIAKRSIFAGPFVDYAYTLARAGRRAPSGPFAWTSPSAWLSALPRAPFRTLSLTAEMFAAPARKAARRDAPLEHDMRVRAWAEGEFSENLAVHKALVHMASGRQLLAELQTQEMPTDSVEARKRHQMVDAQAAMVRSLSTENLYPEWWKTWAKANRRRLEA